MCAYSFVADHYNDKFKYVAPYLPWPEPYRKPEGAPREITREEFERLREDVAEMKRLLERADEYDKRTGQPDCEMDEKLALLRKIAEFVGTPDAVKGPGV